LFFSIPESNDSLSLFSDQDTEREPKARLRPPPGQLPGPQGTLTSSSSSQSLSATTTSTKKLLTSLAPTVAAPTSGKKNSSKISSKKLSDAEADARDAAAERKAETLYQLVQHVSLHYSTMARNHIYGVDAVR
jgi:hypothetical protein